MKWIDANIRLPSEESKENRFIGIVDGEIAFCCLGKMFDFDYIYYPDRPIYDSTTFEHLSFWMPIPKNILLLGDFFLEKPQEKDIKEIAKEEFYDDMMDLIEKYDVLKLKE